MSLVKYLYYCFSNLKWPYKDDTYTEKTVNLAVLQKLNQLYKEKVEK